MYLKKPILWKKWDCRLSMYVNMTVWPILQSVLFSNFHTCPKKRISSVKISCVCTSMFTLLFFFFFLFFVCLSVAPLKTVKLSRRLGHPAMSALTTDFSSMVTSCLTCLSTKLAVCVCSAPEKAAHSLWHPKKRQTREKRPHTAEKKTSQQEERYFPTCAWQIQPHTDTQTHTEPQPTFPHDIQ